MFEHTRVEEDEPVDPGRHPLLDASGNGASAAVRNEDDAFVHAALDLGCDVAGQRFARLIADRSPAADPTPERIGV